MSGIDNPALFETLRDSINALFIANETGRFQTVTEQNQSSGSAESEGLLRIVQVFYAEGSFPEATSTRKFSRHDTTFEINLKVSEVSTLDLATINNEASTPAEVAAAFAAAEAGSYNANISLDTLWRMVFQIVLNPVNNQLGLPQLDKNGDPITDLTPGRNQVADVRLANFRKDEPQDTGVLVTLTGSVRLTVKIEENFVGATAITPTQPAIEVTNEFNTLSDPDDANPAISGANIDTSTP